MSIAACFAMRIYAVSLPQGGQVCKWTGPRGIIPWRPTLRGGRAPHVCGVTWHVRPRVGPILQKLKRRPRGRGPPGLVRGRKIALPLMGTLPFPSHLYYAVEERERKKKGRRNNIMQVRNQNSFSHSRTATPIGLFFVFWPVPRSALKAVA